MRFMPTKQLMDHLPRLTGSRAGAASRMKSVRGYPEPGLLLDKAIFCSPQLVDLLKNYLVLHTFTTSSIDVLLFYLVEKINPNVVAISVDDQFGLVFGVKHQHEAC